jgi:hypothetical protein
MKTLNPRVLTSTRSDETLGLTWDQKLAWAIGTATQSVAPDFENDSN